MLAVFAPGGMERYFEEVAEHVPPSGAGRGPDMASLHELIGRHGLALA